jgi:hypothetical protein
MRPLNGEASMALAFSSRVSNSQTASFEPRRKPDKKSEKVIEINHLRVELKKWAGFCNPGYWGVHEILEVFPHLLNNLPSGQHSSKSTSSHTGG